MGSNEQLIPMEEAILASEAAKEIVATSSVDQSGSSNIEVPSSDTETASISLQDDEKAIRLPLSEGKCGAEACLESETKDGRCPDSEKFSEVECGISSSEINFHSEMFASDLEPEVISLENMQISEGNRSSHASGDGQMHSQESSFSGAARDMVVGGLCFALNNADLSFERDLSNASNDVQVDLHSSPRNVPLNGSTVWCEKWSSKHVNGPLLGKDMKNFELENDVLSVEHFTTDDSVPSSGHADVQEGCIVTSELVGNLTPYVNELVPLQSCASSMAVESGSCNNQVKQEAALRLNGLIYGNNSMALADVSCHEDAEIKGNADIGDFVGEPNDALSSVQRSSHSSKYNQKAPKRTYSRKGGKKASNRTVDLLPAAVRSKRSCLNRSPCASKWGLVDILSKHSNHSSSIADQGSGFVKNGAKDRKLKVQVGTSSKGSKGANRASSGHIRLKVKLGKQGNSIILQSPPVEKDSVADDATRGRMQKSTQFPTSIENLDKPASCQQRTEVDVSKSCVLGSSNSSDKKVNKSGVSTSSKYLNSGTSPDSEVIQAIDSQFASKALEVCQVEERHSCKALHVLGNNASPAKSQMRRGKANKKGKLPLSGDSDIQDRLSPTILGQNAVSKVYCEDDTLSNVACNMATRRDGRHEAAESCKLKELLPLTEAQGNKKSKASKGKGTTKNNTKPTNARSLGLDNSHKGKGDKWKLTSAYSISENGIDDQVHVKKERPEAGNPIMDDSTNKTSATSSGVTYEDISGQPIIAGEVGQQIMRPRIAWVCCDDCLKWRCIPAELADIIDDTSCRWTCKDNQDKAFADCSIPQEKSNAEINAELNISDDEDGCDANPGGRFFSMRHAAVPQQSSWMLIESNIFLHRSRKTQSLDEIMVCHCKPPQDGKLGCGDKCLNRMLNIECAQETCPCGDLCSNQQFQKRNYATLKWFRCGKKGYGLQVLEDISEGQFLIEYVGEVLDLLAYEARQREYASKGHKHFYFMTLNGNEVIDACAKGNLGRFINHSCDPNCRTEKWMVNGEICIGLFAVRDIKKGEELTFDYNYVRFFGAAAKKCYCGSANCRGYIGGDPLNTEVVVQGDSDEEFPEPVVVYENGQIGNSLHVMSKPNSLDVMEKKKEDTLLRQAADVLPDGKEIVNKVKKSLTSLQGQLPCITEKDALHPSMVECSQVRSLEILGNINLEHGDKITSDVQQEKPISDMSGITSVSPKISDRFSLNRWHPELFSVTSDTISDKSKSEMAGGKPISKVRPRMKKCRPFKFSKGKESGTSSATIEKDLVINRSQAMSNKPKKLVESSSKPHFETVEEKLNELLDSVGGICKQKDAVKGYLKLLVLTAASGDGSHHETIQSNKDLSMILDAILKTKSRTVLTDIINKNGLQMLHSMMKKCRGNFNMIPILRKLLKVFEFLAERKILTVEHINGDSHRPGVESFRDSILTLTEHEDRKVHQIARSFRDRWIPRPVKKFSCMEKCDQNMDFNRASSCSRFLGLRPQWRDKSERLLETMGYVKHSPPSSHFIGTEMPESASPHVSECVTNMRTSRKRKSRWDQPTELVSPRCSEEQKIDNKAGASCMHLRGKELTCNYHLHAHYDQIQRCRGDDERQEMEEDAPPGFSCPSVKARNTACSSVIPISQLCPGPLKCPFEVSLGNPQERINSHLPVAYGIPLNVVQQFGTPQAATSDGWIIAPGRPFRPFPPLPPHPRKQGKREGPPSTSMNLTTDGSAVRSQEHSSLPASNQMNQGFPSLSNGRLPNTFLASNTQMEGGRGPYSHERRYFK